MKLEFIENGIGHFCMDIMRGVACIGYIGRDGDGVYFPVLNNYRLTSIELRAIADKLDEMNGKGIVTANVANAIGDEEIALDFATELRAAAGGIAQSTKGRQMLERAEWLEEVAERAVEYRKVIGVKS